MGNCFLHGNGGGGGSTALLNYDVVRYDPGAVLPETAKANTIAVFTRVDITSHIFSATEPAALENGMVWFLIGTSSPTAFNALKKNGIMVYPLVAKQYVNGALVDIEAKSYQNGAWADWCTMLYYRGNEFESITGGWGLSSNYLYSSGGNITKNGDRMVFESHLVDGSSYAHAFLRPNNKIDLSDVASIILVTKSVSLDNTAVPMKLCVKDADIVSQPTTEKNVVASTAIMASNTEQEFTLNVNALNGSYFVGIETNSNNGGKVEILEFKIQ